MASSSSSSHPAPGSSSRSYTSDVFLSFRGDDTRKTFVDHLYKALVDMGIITFKDDRGLHPGEFISPALFTAIEGSQIALIVLSENYADSSWCLEELAYIMKCSSERGLIVMPIFYHVEPTEVRKQKGKFGEAFARHDKENITKVVSWREALADVSKIAGFDVKNRHESEFIKEIVNTILDRLLPSNPYVDEKLVGMKTRLEDFTSKLNIGSGGVHMVGICGLGGGGKTTLANSLFMKISHLFNGSCILEDIGKESSKDYLKELQNKLLSHVLKAKMEVESVVQGKITIQRMLHGRKVLVILDDVWEGEQLEALAGSRDWFGSGSRIIITTRDENLLNAHNVDNVCPLKLLSGEEAMELFNKHARNEKEPLKDYESLSLRVVSYAAGLPLALKVLGSFLCDKDERQWMSALARLEHNPNMKIVDKLKISYDGLDTPEKEIFLDIACFFRGKKIDEVMEILEACGFHPQIEVKALTQKSLMTISVNGEVEMHDLVQEMGHHIVKEESSLNPENRRRVWKEEEIRSICLGDATKEKDKIEAMGFLLFYKDDVLRFCKNVSNMKFLRWLSVSTKGTHAGDEGLTSCFWKFVPIVKLLGCLRVMTKNEYDEGLIFLSNELRYIDWNGYPGISFPDSFQPIKLVVLRLSWSFQMKVLWESHKGRLIGRSTCATVEGPRKKGIIFHAYITYIS